MIEALDCRGPVVVSLRCWHLRRAHACNAASFLRGGVCHAGVLSGAGALCSVLGQLYAAAVVGANGCQADLGRLLQVWFAVVVIGR